MTIPRTFPSPASLSEKKERFDGPGTPILTRVKNPAFEPRDPVIRGRGTDDLIAFLREGPPGSGSSKPTPRENMERRTADKFLVPMPGNTSNLTLHSGSKHESVNSHSPLLHQSSVRKSDQQSHSARNSGTDPSQLHGEPKKSARIKDPYALPSDDEDNDILTALPKRTRNEESLMDFLNSTGPSVPANVPSRQSQDAPRTVGLGLRDSSGKGLSLRPSSPASGQGAGATRSSVNMAPLIANPTSGTTIPALGEFLSSKNSVESERPASAAKSYSFTSQSTPTHTPTRARPSKPVRTESRNGSVRDFLRKMTAA